MDETFRPYPGGVRDPRKPEKFVICKTRSGRTLVAKKPFLDLNLGSNGFHKPVQKMVRKAVTYAEFASGQPIYQCKAVGTQSSAYHLAVTDYMGAPSILDIDIHGWTGGIGQEI